MTFLLTPYREKKIAHFWSEKTALERLKLIMQYEDLFWALELVTSAELKVVWATSSSNRQYVLNREDQPFFVSINLHQPLDEQVHSQKLKAALNAVLFKSGDQKWPYFSGNVSMKAT
jgi:hypothetical protein